MRDTAALTGIFRSRAAIRSSALSNAAPSPNCNHGSSSNPRSTHSMAKAIVPPALIVSMPRSSHRREAASTASQRDHGTLASQFFDGDQRATVLAVVVHHFDNQVIAAVLSFDANSVRQPPHRGMIEKHSLKQDLQQVHDEIMAPNVS